MVSKEEVETRPQLSEDELASQTADWEGMAQEVQLGDSDQELKQALEDDLKNSMTPG